MPSTVASGRRTHAVHRWASSFHRAERYTHANAPEVKFLKRDLDVPLTDLSRLQRTSLPRPL
jgi:hypothetical protein